MNLAVRNDQRGIGHLALALIVLAVIVIGGVALRVSQDSSNSGDSTEDTKGQAVSACLLVYKDKELCQFTANYAIDKISYKIVEKSNGPDGSSTRTYLSDGKGNSSMAETGGGLETNSIIYNGVAYEKDTDGSWFKFARGDKNAPKDANPAGDIKFNIVKDDKQKSGKPAETNITYKQAAKEKCGDLNCLKYQLIDSSQPSATQYFWFDTKDYRLQKYTFNDSQGTDEIEVTYLPVRIKAPSPTKDFAVPEAVPDFGE